MQLGDNCFHVSLEEMNWADAERYCRKIGGFLAEIMSEEDEFLLDNFLIGGTSYWLGAVHKLRHFKIDLYGSSNNDST